MIKKVKGGYVVVSHTIPRKRLSRIYKSKARAVKRLKQILYFKMK